jgi:hypothetical protein
LLVIVFWLVGAAAIIVYWAAGGIEAAGQPLETLAPASPLARA